MRAFGCSFVLLFLAGCAHEDDAVIGTSNGTRAVHPPVVTRTVAADPGLPADWRKTFTKSAPKTSRGHGTGHWSMTVYGDADGMDALDHQHDAKPGARLVAEHPPFAKAARDGTHTDASRTVLFIMEKRDKEWTYRVQDENGAITRDPPECADCHDESPSDHLFILPN